ncbi:MAG TPA: NAD(P)/FAD-dependent oxidoreductase [Emcibacteraceae bacterium]|nr:NAD(P)/FAD-dependent oxidoreductase [Emcibacteraceae bacterium]
MMERKNNFRMTDHIEIIIIGAGVIGLSIAKSLAEKGHEVLVIEKEKDFGMGISSRNSEVIHAGLYFTPEMQKTTLCIKEKKRLYDYAKSHHITHHRCGKLIVASSHDEIPKLRQIYQNANNCGIDDLAYLTKDQCKSFEPDIVAEAGLFSPSSGIIDSHSYMLSLLGDLEAAGGKVAYNVNIRTIEKSDRKFLVSTSDDYQISSNWLINAAGLGAMNIAHLIKDLDPGNIPELIMAKGHYFSYSGKTRFRHLVYPIPFVGGLGVHLTLDMAGGVKFGPDVHFIDHENYSVDPALKDDFVNSVKRYFPAIDADKLHPGYAGIRPKLSRHGKDFNIQFEKEHAIKGLVNLFGMESPGLTASLAIADYITEKLYES